MMTRSAMTLNARIVTEAWAFVREGRGPSKSGQCLAFVRQVIEAAARLNSHDLYRHYVTERVEVDAEREGNERAPWARDAERSLRNLGMAVSTAGATEPVGETHPGDLVFDYRAAPSNYWGANIGHVGIVMPYHWVLENIAPQQRPDSLTRAPYALTPLDTWGVGDGPTTVIRFDPDRTA